MDPLNVVSPGPWTERLECYLENNIQRGLLQCTASGWGKGKYFVKTVLKRDDGGRGLNKFPKLCDVKYGRPVNKKIAYIANCDLTNRIF